jgi:hypothetical protein
MSQSMIEEEARYARLLAHPFHTILRVHDFIWSQKAEYALEERSKMCGDLRALALRALEEKWLHPAKKQTL